MQRISPEDRLSIGKANSEFLFPRLQDDFPALLFGGEGIQNKFDPIDIVTIIEGDLNGVFKVIERMDSAYRGEEIRSGFGLDF